MNKALFAIALLLAAVFLLQNRYYYFHDKRVVFRVDRIMNTVEVRLRRLRLLDVLPSEARRARTRYA